MNDNQRPMSAAGAFIFEMAKAITLAHRDAILMEDKDGN